MTGIKLYELTEARDILDLFLAEEEGVETPEIAALFAELAGDIDEKVERTALWIKEKDAESAALKAEEQRLAARRKTIENRVDRTKRYLEYQLELLGRDKVNGLLVTVALQLNNPKLVGELSQDQLADLEVEHVDVLRGCVKLIPAARQLDRGQALLALKEGHAIAGLSVERSRSLRIR